MTNETMITNDYTPFNMFGGMDREIHNVMDTFLKGPSSRIKNDYIPTCEVNERDDCFVVSFDIPGISKDNINVDLAEGKLHIYGERKNDLVEGGYTERRYGKFERYMSLPVNIEVSDADATFDDGVLSVSFRKTGKTKIRRLEVGNKKSRSLWSGLLGDDKTKSPNKDSRDSKLHKSA